MSQQSVPTPMPYSQHSQMSQPGTDQGPPGQHGSHGPPGYMAPGQGRYPNQMPSQPVDQYGQQGYPGNQPGYGPKPMMNQDQYQGYQPPGYGPKPSMPMGSGIYNTPNKTFPPSRTDAYMSPGELTVLRQNFRLGKYLMIMARKFRINLHKKTVLACIGTTSLK